MGLIGNSQLWYVMFITSVSRNSHWISSENEFCFEVCSIVPQKCQKKCKGGLICPEIGSTKYWDAPLQYISCNCNLEVFLQEALLGGNYPHSCLCHLQLIQSCLHESGSVFQDSWRQTNCPKLSWHDYSFARTLSKSTTLFSHHHTSQWTGDVLPAIGAQTFPSACQTVGFITPQNMFFFPHSRVQWQWALPSHTHWSEWCKVRLQWLSHRSYRAFKRQNGCTSHHVQQSKRKRDTCGRNYTSLILWKHV